MYIDGNLIDPVEHFYGDILTRMAERGLAPAIQGGYEMFLRQYFVRRGEKHELAEQLRRLCGLSFKDREPAIEFFGLHRGRAMNLRNLATLYGLPEDRMRAKITFVEDRAIDSLEMIEYMRSSHPEIWPSATPQPAQLTEAWGQMFAAG